MRDHRTHLSASTHAPRFGARAFTLVELLVVVAIIAILVSLVVVASRGVSRSAATTRTTSMLASISQAIAQFKGDLGFEPPLISRVLPTGNTPAGLTGGVVTPELEGQISGDATDVLKAYRRQRFSSQFSLPAFLMGIGSMSGRPLASNNQSYPPNTAAVPETSANYRTAALDDGIPGPGIRSPGQFRAWKKPGATPNTITHSPDLSGRTYGPYLDPDQMSGILQLVEVVPGTATTPMRARVAGVDGATNIWMYRFVEPSGEAVRYYRQWTTRDAAGSPPNQPSTERVPFELREADAVKLALSNGAPNWQPLPSDRDAMTASYMLFAPNVDRVEKFLNPTGGAPFETEIDRVLEEGMPFIGVPDPKFSAGTAAAGADGPDRTRRILDLAARAVRLAPQ